MDTFILFPQSADEDLNLIYIHLYSSPQALEEHVSLFIIRKEVENALRFDPSTNQ